MGVRGWLVGMGIMNEAFRIQVGEPTGRNGVWLSIRTKPTEEKLCVLLPQLLDLYLQFRPCILSQAHQYSAVTAWFQNLTWDLGAMIECVLEAQNKTKQNIIKSRPAEGLWPSFNGLFVAKSLGRKKNHASKTTSGTQIRIQGGPK